MSPVGGAVTQGHLGIWSDRHMLSLARLAREIKAKDSVATIQLHHGGRRASSALNGKATLCPWDDDEQGVRAMTTAEVHRVTQDFIRGAERASDAGFDGVELHGAHGYLIGEFLDLRNQRADGYGGRLDDRVRMLFEIVDGIRDRTRPDFQLGVRLSPERYGISLDEAKIVAEWLMTSGKLDFLDMSLWDVFKEPEEAPFHGKPLISHFTGLARGNTRLGVAGHIGDARTAQSCLNAGADYVLIGRGAVLHSDFPRRAIADPAFTSMKTPVTREYLRKQGVSDPFLGYLIGFWPDFVTD